ncbi:putative Polyketide biosynthesis cytochrome P450 PksS [uncultured Sphingopyxis sp.]|nr:cytochrome P450 [uncultured Sphingopyxis sp.]SBV32547.1 putative Polyketide biosynthesis cytochrome P450 PksS [uncultured Sphingopyxis sp.]
MVLTSEAPPIDVDALDQSKVVRIDLGSQETKQRMRELSADWAKREPIYIPRDGFVFVLCTRQADALEVYKDVERFPTAVPKKPGYEMFDKFMGIKILAQMDGEPHSRVRRLMNNALAPKAVTRLEDRMRAAIDRLLDRIEEKGGKFDAMADYGNHLIVEGLLTVMLKLNPEQKKIFTEMHRVIPLVTYTEAGHNYPDECVKAFADAREAIQKLIDERRADPGDDLISDLIAARDNDDKLSDEEMFDQIFTLTAGALGGTTNAIGGVFYSLYQHPDAIRVLQKEPELITGAVAEAQRWHSGSYMTFPRFAQRDTEVGGTKILKGMVVRISSQAAHYDPTVYDNPLEFDVRRNPRIVAFGSGPHACLGFFLARSLMRIAVEQLITRFPDARLENPDMPVTYSGSVGELRVKSLPMLTQ